MTTAGIPHDIGTASAESVLRALAQSPAFICVLRGPAHVFEYANINYYRLVGERPLLGKPIREALPEIAGQGFYEILDGVYATGKPFVGTEVSVDLGSGAARETRLVDFVYEALRDADGKIDGIIAHGVDVTERVRAREAADRERRLYEGILTSIEDIVNVFDPTGRFLYANRRLLDLWGLKLSDIRGKSFTELGYPDDLAARLDAQIAQVAATQQPLMDETPYTSPTGVAGVYEYMFAPVVGPDGKVDMVAGTTRDITARKLSEAELTRAHADVKRASLLKDEFLATLSHELRTPMSAIMGWAQVLERRAPDDPLLRKAVDAILRNARAQAQLIEDIVDLSRIEAGKVRLSLQAVDLYQVASSAAESLAPLADAKSVAIAVAPPPHAMTVRADPDRLQQVLWNLLSNAVKFSMADGRVSVRLRHEGDDIVASVADDGIGIRADFLPFVFDRFRQADGSTTRRAGGLGVGLSVARQLVELQGGSVVAHSAGEGQGATFSVRLPAYRGPVADAGGLADAGAPAAASATARTSLAGVTVLVVDDEADIRTSLQHLLEDAGARALLAAGADEGLAITRREHVDAALCDIQMPRQDGYAFLRALRQEHGTAIPVVAFSAMAQVEDQARALAAGFRAFLSKPLPAQEVVAALVGVLDGATPRV